MSYDKYLKYKNKYNDLKQIQHGGLSADQQKLINITFSNNSIDYIKDTTNLSNHIKAKIQILILCFHSGRRMIPEFAVTTSTSWDITQTLVENYIEILDAPKTWSKLYCPLIWRSLKKANILYSYIIPEEWTFINSKDDLINNLIDEASVKLIGIKGWVSYAMHILQSNIDLNKKLNDTPTDSMFDISEIIDKLKVFRVNSINDLSKDRLPKIDILFDNGYNAINISNNDYQQNVVVYFEIASGKFSGLNKIANFNGSIILIQDKNFKWYTENHDIIKTFLLNELQYKSQIIFTGVSMGGYGALIFSSYFDNAICISFSPQTFNIVDKVKSKVWLGKVIGKDLRNILRESKNSKKYIIVGTGECDTNAYWGDLMMVGHVKDIKNVKILVVNQRTHGTLYYVDFTILSKLLLDNYKNFYDNIDIGLQILKDTNFYYPKKVVVINSASIKNDIFTISEKSWYNFNNLLLLNKSSAKIFVYKKNDSNIWLVLFSENNNFNLTKDIINFTNIGNIIYFRNIQGFDKNIITLLHTDAYLKKATNIFILGDNLAGNVALVVSSYYNNSICITFNPLTFNDNNVIGQDVVINNFSNVIDIRKLKVNESTKYAIFGITDCLNENNKTNINLVHAGYILGQQNIITKKPNIEVLIIDYHNINIIENINLSAFIKLFMSVPYIRLKDQDYGKEQLVSIL
jgi:hypothetical protein